jgi:hypothetical protein
MNEFTINDNSIIVYGSFRGRYTGEITYSGTTAVFNPDVDYLPGEVITVTVTEEAKNTSDVPLARGFTFNFTAAATGFGLFDAPVTFTGVPGENATDVVAADFNGDGNVDLAVLSQGANTVYVHFSNGDGTFAAPVVLANRSGAIAMKLVAADVSGNGHPDLLVANISAFSLAVFLNNGDDTFNAREDYATSASLGATDMVVMDITSNGTLDVVQLHYGSPSASQFLFHYSNNGSGAFGTGSQITIADLNSGGSLAVSYHSATTMSSNSLYQWRPHLLVTDYTNNQLRVYENIGSGTEYLYSQTKFAGTDPVAVGGFRLFTNSPGADAVVLNSGSNNMTVYRAPEVWSGDNFASQSNFSTGNSPTAVTGGDLNGNGSIDLIVVNGGDGTLSYLPNTTGTFFDNISYSVGANATQAVLADMNGNGRLDVVTANTNGSVSILYNYPGPEIVSISPANNATEVDPFSVITIEFSTSSMDVSTLTASNILVTDASDATVASSFDFAGSTLTITPNAPFQQGSVITVEVTDNVKTNADLAIINPTTISFTVAESVLEITGLSPAQNVTQHPLNGTISISFSETVNLSSLDAGVFVRGSVRGEYTGTWSGASTVTFTPDSDFIAGEVISVRITPSVTSVIGSPLEETFQYSFLTESNSLGSFLAGASFDEFLYTDGIATADMNGNGHPDIIVGEYDYNLQEYIIYVLINDGFGSIASILKLSTGIEYADKFLVADYNSDGISDVVLLHSPYYDEYGDDGEGEAGQIRNKAKAFVGATTMSGAIRELIVLPGIGDGTFGTPIITTLPTGDSYSNFAQGDLNGNGLIDLVVVREEAGDAFVGLNNGNGTFNIQSPLNVSGEPNTVVLADLNLDGVLDLVLGDVYNNLIEVRLGNGNGTFNAASTYSTDSSPYVLEVGDFNNDGYPDLISIDNMINVLLNNGSGGFTPSQTFEAGYRTALIDFNGDSYLDLVTQASWSGGLAVYLNNGNGTFETSSRIFNSPSIQHLNAIDFNGDGSVDIIASNQQEVFLIRSVPPVFITSFTPESNALDIDANQVITITFNVEMDVATLSASTVQVHSSLRGNLSGTYIFSVGSNVLTFTPDENYLAGEVISVSVSRGAQSATGVPIEAGKYFSFTAEADGYGFFEAETAGSFGNFVYQTEGADMTGNGELELIVSEANSGIKIFEYDEFGEYSLLSTLTISSVNRFWVYDINSDGSADIIVHRSSDPNIYFFLNDGLGGFVETNLAQVDKINLDMNTFGRVGLAFGDFNGNGRVDIAYSMPGYSNARLAIMNEDLTSNFGGFVGNAGGYDIQFADLNRDGNLDLVWASDSDQGTVHIALGQGGGAFASPIIRSVGERPESIVVGDFTGNGYLDIATADVNGGSYSVIINNNGTFAQAAIYTVPGFQPNKIFAADVDGDGDLDLLVSGRLDVYMEEWDETAEMHKVIVAYNDGNGGFGNQLSYGVDFAEPEYFNGPQSISVFDADGDGRLDIVGRATGYDLDFNYIHNIVVMKNVPAGASVTPEIAASNGSASNVTFSDATLNWTNGDGLRRLVLVKEGAPVDATLTDNAGYGANPKFGLGTEVGDGNFVVFGGTGNAVTVSGLDEETTYHFAVYEINGIPGQEKVLTADPATGSFTTASAPPVWRISEQSITFSKTNYADWTLEENQDRISNGVWITRRDYEGVFNIKSESSFSGSTSPAGTLWSFGTADDIPNLTFTNWRNATGQCGECVLDGPMVMYLTKEKIYIEVEFTSFTGNDNGGGFSYIRGDGIIPPLPPLDFDSVVGNAVAFDATQSQYFYMQLLDGDNEYLPTKATVEFWAKPTVLDVNQYLFSFGGGSDRFSVRLNDTNQFVAYHDEANAEIVSSVTASVGQWYHVAVSAEYDGSLKLYINGVLQGVESVYDYQVSGWRWYVGSRRFADYFTGVIDEFLVWETIRTESEIRSGMHSTLSGTGEDVYMYFQFNESSGDPTTLINDYVYVDTFNGTYVTSDAPIGQGTSTSVAGVQTGTTTIGNAALSLTTPFENPVDVVVTEVTAEPNIWPDGFSASLGGKYFVIDLFGDPGVFSADLTLTFGEGVVTAEQQNTPSLLKLYKRESNSNGAWSEIASAVTAVASTGEVTWTGITSFSQFIVIETEVTIFDGAEANITVRERSVPVEVPASAFPITSEMASATFTITSNVEFEGTLFIDENENGVYDDGVDLLVNDVTGVSYTPSGTKKLMYVTESFGLESATLTFVNESLTENVTLNAISIQGTAELAGNADENAWQLVSSPLNTSLGNMFANIWTQGAVNSNAPEGDATLYTFNQETGAYQAITGDLDETIIASGTGILAYVFAFDDYELGIPVGGGWPKQLTPTGHAYFTDNFDIPVKNVDLDGNSVTSGSEGFVLLGNPFAWPLDVSTVVTKLKALDTNANSYVYRWDPVGGNYQLVTSGAIRPYESVFVRLVSSGVEATLSLTNDDQYIQAPKQVVDDLFAFTLGHAASGLESASHLRFDSTATTGIDPYDGYYLGTYASTYANLYTRIDDQALVINNLPIDMHVDEDFPIHMHASVSGDFTLNWDAAKLPKGWDFILTETATGRQVNLREQASFAFTSGKNMKIASTTTALSVGGAQADVHSGVADEYDTQNASDHTPGIDGSDAPHTAKLDNRQAETTASSDQPVFILRVRSNVIGTDIATVEIPNQVELLQNYPNPFNPVTQIRYGVPVQSNVTLEVYDILGRRVAQLLNNDIKEAGRYTVSFDGRNLASGVYIYRLVVGDKQITKSMVLIK